MSIPDGTKVRSKIHRCWEGKILNAVDYFNHTCYIIQWDAGSISYEYDDEFEVVEAK